MEQLLYLLYGFLLWPISGFLWIGSWNLYIYIKKANSIGYYNWYEGLLGMPILISITGWSIYCEMKDRSKLYNQ